MILGQLLWTQTHTSATSVCGLLDKLLHRAAQLLLVAQVLRNGVGLCSWPSSYSSVASSLYNWAVDPSPQSPLLNDFVRPLLTINDDDHHDLLAVSVFIPVRVVYISLRLCLHIMFFTIP